MKKQKNKNLAFLANTKHNLSLSLGTCMKKYLYISLELGVTGVKDGQKSNPTYFLERGSSKVSI